MRTQASITSSSDRFSAVYQTSRTIFRASPKRPVFLKNEATALMEGLVFFLRDSWSYLNAGFCCASKKTLCDRLCGHSTRVIYSLREFTPTDSVSSEKAILWFLHFLQDGRDKNDRWPIRKLMGACLRLEMWPQTRPGAAADVYCAVSTAMFHRVSRIHRSAWRWQKFI